MKHEGYTPGPWKWDCFDGTEQEITHNNGLLLFTINDWSKPNCFSANLSLIADAPRLAKENERLRNAVQVAISHITGGITFPSDFIWDEAEVLSILEKAHGEGRE